MIKQNKNQNNRTEDPRDAQEKREDPNQREENRQENAAFEDNPGDEQENTAQEEPEQEDNEQAEDNHNETKEGDSNKASNLQKEYDELSDKHLRLFSEFDNFRKRTMREKSDLMKTASGELIKEMLPLLDDMERALEAIPEDQKEAHKGMELIYNKLKGILKNRGLKEMDAKGKPFDTDYHEAITQIPAPKESLKGKVVEVVEKGYFLHDKVLRFAKVVVGK
ncbi:MAG: nucleotide exchange factor GrpE [Bacteroidales bacterium]